MGELDKIFDRVNFDSPLLDRAITEAYRKKDSDRCIDGLIKHFATRSSPGYFFTAGDVKKLKDEKIIKDADDEGDVADDTEDADDADDADAVDADAVDADAVDADGADADAIDDAEAVDSHHPLNLRETRVKIF